MDLSFNISVLMAVHNGEKARNLHKALCSLNNQSLQPKQIVLVEDGPLGGQLMDEIEHWQSVWGRRLTIVRNAENLGLTASLNRGIEQVCNPIIARMDSDDIAHPRRFERQARFLRQHPDIDIVGGSIKEFNDEGRNLATRHYPLTHNAVLLSIHRASPLAHPAVMMRSRIFQRGLRYDERYRTSQDIALWFDAICAGFRIANIPDTVLYFRRRVPRNVTLTYNGLAMAPIEVAINSALFEWVVENLMKNSLDALQGQGTIEVVVGETDKHVFVEVSDTGKGIPKSNWTRIFEPGFTTKTRGWGLGLSLSRRIIEEYHKGRIAVVRSEIGKGTTIRVTLNRNDYE
jgi:glycosyltransferase involved in cell wall biosynthesis